MKEDKLLEDAYAKGNLKLETPSTELLGLLSSAGGHLPPFSKH